MDKKVFVSYSSKDKKIADTIVHRLEENGIRCWIAPRDINFGDWAGAIMEGLHRCEVFVVVITHNSIVSPEVTKEVTEATRTCTYLLPFKVEQGMLPARLQYHLGPCHWLDAVTPPLEKHIDELIERIRHLSEDDAVYFNSGRMKLVEKISSPRGGFVGRQREIREIAEAFEEDHIVFLHGMGGIGKSEIARGYAQEHRSDYDTILLANYTSNLMDLVCGEDIMIENLSRISGEDSEQWFRRKLEAFRSLASTRTLLIIDNFDTSVDEHMDEVFSIPCHILVTSRNDYSYYRTIHVGPIKDFGMVRRIFSDHYGRSIREHEQKAVDDMLRLVGCHTITVELIARQMKASFLKPEKMLQRLHDTGVNTRLKEKIRREGTLEKRTGFDYIRQLFTFSGVNATEQHMLCIMALVPASGIQVSMLGEILDMDDYDAINELTGKSWLILDEENISDECGEVLRMHPVIKDVVLEELTPTPDSCADYIEGLRKKSINMWIFDLREKNDFFSLVRQIVIEWPEPTPVTLNTYIDLINVLWMGSDFTRAQSFGEGVYEYALRECGSAHHETGRAALNVGGAYHNAGDDITAEIWYRKAYEHMMEVGGQVTATLAMACFKIGRCAVSRGDLEVAQPYYDRAVELYDDLIARKIFLPGRAYPDQYTDLIHGLAKVERLKGNYKRSIELEEQCCRQNLESFGRKTVSFGYYYLGMGICYSKMGEWDRADDLMGKSLELYTDHLGTASLQTMECREAIADSILARGDRKEAVVKLNGMLLDLEKYFGEKNPLTVRIRKKAEALEGI